MNNNIGDPALINQMADLDRQLAQAIKLMGKYGREWAQAQADYQIKKAVTAESLHAEGRPATMIALILKGKVATELFKRDTAEVMYKTAIEHVNAVKLRMRVLDNQIDREWGAVK